MSSSNSSTSSTSSSAQTARASTVAPASSSSVLSPAVLKLLAGQFAGTFGLALCYPLDTVKVRMQTRPAGTYKNMRDCFKQMAKTEGISSFYRGLLSPVIGYGLIKASYFFSYEFSKEKIIAARSPINTQELSLFESMLCSAFGGFCQTFIRAPVEQIKVVMQSRIKPGSTLPPYSGTIACLRDVIRTEGVSKGLYRSFWPTMSREVPQYALYYPAYLIFCKLLAEQGQTSTDLAPWKTAIAGGMAGVSQWAPTYSLDVIKSKVSAAPPGTYRSTYHCAVDIYQKEGVTVFFRGMSAALVRAFFLHGAVFVGMETASKFLKKVQ